MRVARNRAKIRLTLWFGIPLAAALVSGGLAAPAGATTVATLGNVTSLVSNAQSGSTCALISTGKVDCWGYNGNGQLGNGSTTDSDVPVPAIGLSGVKALATSYDGGSFCAVLSTGKVKCWGNNGNGQLGNGNTTSFTLPVSVKNLSTATAITGGDYGFCAVLLTSHVDCWGDGGNGDLGNGTFNNSDVPVAVRTITNAAKVLAGDDGFCALLSTGHVDCWGYGGSGGLGNGAFNTSDVPVAVHTIANATAIAADRDDGTYCARLFDRPRGLLGVQRPGPARQRVHHELGRAGGREGYQHCHGGRRQRRHHWQLLRGLFERPPGLLGVQRVRRARQRHHGDLHAAGGGQEPQHGYRRHRRTGRLLRPAVDQSSGLLGVRRQRRSRQRDL